jgi:putative flippase GtrA
MSIFNKINIKEIFRFGIVGVLATSIQYIVYISLYKRLGTNIAYTIGYLVSLCGNFILSNYFTFKTKPSKDGGLKFILAHGFNYILQMFLLNLVIYINVSEKIAPFIVYSISIPINYLLVRKALNKGK